jgi:hypothetical protein
MNRKQFIILLVLVVVVGAAGMIIHQRGSDSWQSAGQGIGQKLLPDLPVNDIAQITIKSGTNEFNLAKRDNLWRVRERGDYPANFSQISGLLLKFADLKSAQSQEVGPSQLGRFELLPPSAGANAGTLIEFKDAAGKTRESVLLGKKHMKKPAANGQFGGMGDEGWPDGRYVMVGSDTKTLMLVSDPLDIVEPKPDSWLNKDFLSIEKPSSISVQFPEATNSWKLTRASETNDWQLADAKAGEKLDSSNISSVTSPFSSASFNDVLPGDTQPEISGLTNVVTLTVETFDGFTYNAKIGQKRGDDFPVAISIGANLPSERAAATAEKPEDTTRLDREFKDQVTKLTEKLSHEKQFQNWVYYMPAFVLDPILKPRNQLLAEEKKDAPSPAENH